MVLNDKNKELEALISLLDEPDAAIFSKVKERFFLYGHKAIPALENAWDNTFDDIIQKRIEDIIHEIQLKQLYRDLSAWRTQQSEDLMQGFMLISRYAYPDQDEKKIIDHIGAIIQDVWLELNANLTPLEKVKVISHIVFDVHKFEPNKPDSQSPRNNYLKDILETKKANPVSLSIIFIVVAQSLHIPVYGVNLPQNFIMAYTDQKTENTGSFSRDDVIFYINAFNRGAVFTRREVELFIRQMNLEEKDSYFLPCENTAILKRVFNNLIVAYENAGDTAKTDELKYLMKALNP